jgi:NDP-sugar pyrophosphorylase family protein
MTAPQIVITMAGFGRRFLDAGYDLPKYRLPAHGRSLFSWSLSSLTSFIENGSPVVFIARQADSSGAFIAAEAARMGLRDWQLVEITHPTDGQATTVLHAASALEADKPVLIYNIDTYVEAHALPCNALRGDGWIPCFPGSGEAWSFARTEDDSHRVIEVREKKRISAHASIGLYGFRSYALYAEIYAKFYRTNATMEAGERYIAPMYNTLIAEGGTVFMHPVPLAAMHPIGTPEEYRAFCADAAGAS